MGLRFRKSFSLGKHFRINVSKSGIGYSYGTKGIRRTVGANGRKRTTLSVPGTGISYTIHDKKHSSKRHNQSKSVNHSGKRRVASAPHPKPILGIEDTQYIRSADIGQLQSTEFSDVIHQIQHVIELDKIADFIAICGIFLLMASFVDIQWYTSLFFLILLSGIIMKFIVRILSSNGLEYEFDDFARQRFDIMANSIMALNKSKVIWQILSYNNVTNQKLHSGAKQIVSRKIVRFSNNVPFYLRSNILFPNIKLNSETLYFLPDFVLIVRGTRLGTVKYQDCHFMCSTTSFIENGAISKDAQVIGTTWEYVNKDGSPDKRYNNNRKLFKCCYGVLHITSNNGLDVVLHTSNPDVVRNLKI